jgi:KipI family sensor histidine kinase inhibitor
MDIRVFGADHVMVGVGDSQQALALYLEAKRRGVDATAIVPAASTVLFEGVPDPSGLVRSLPGWRLEVAEVAGEVVEVPTTYDGEDLDDVAGLWDVTPEEVVALHTGTEFVVAFNGFAPGFAYCTGLAEERAVPRLERPRSRVPAGSVGLAGPYTGVYPTASPGGWRLIGRTDLTLWDVERDPPATLPPGTRVRFVRA